MTGSSNVDNTREKTPELTEYVLKNYPLEVFPNWNITSGERYYVRAPIDKLLGKWSFHIRSHVTSLILAGNPAIAFLQSFHSPFLVKLAYFFSFLGLEEFFTGLIVTAIWLFDAKLGRLLSVLLSLGFFISGSLKVGLSLPRPPAPPAIRHGEENKDWAWPSNHALLGTAFPWFIWIYASSHYDLSIPATFLLLFAIVAWNTGVSWARVYLSVHSPCDVLAGWTIGVLLLFIFEGFSDKLHAFYVRSAADDASFFVYFYSFLAFLMWIHPRSWPETQSYGEVICVLSGTATIWTGRWMHLNGPQPPISLHESNPDSSALFYVARMIVGIGSLLAVRVVAKLMSKNLVKMVYKMLSLRYYSYSEHCKALGNRFQPTKRYTSRLRFKPIPGEKVISMDDVPYDIELPVKYLTYSCIGFMVGEGCPALFAYFGI